MKNSIKTRLIFGMTFLNILILIEGILALLTSDNKVKLTIMLAFIAVGTIFNVIFIRSLLHNITKPIKSLSDASNELAEGNVNIVFSINAVSELEELESAMTRMIANIKDQAAILEKISIGDYTAHIQPKSNSDLLNIKLKTMADNTNEIIRRLSDATAQVDVGASQISSSSQMLAQGATEQAAAVEQLSANVSEVARQTAANASNAENVNKLALKIRENAGKSNEQINELLSAVQEIDEDSNIISSIISVMDNIAFQTNILALNAAVEAARSGVNGKGFAVVAAEVKSLATKSSAAAKETEAMIADSIVKTESSARIAKKTSDAVKSIFDEINEAVEGISQISRDSNEQAANIAQLNTGLKEISQVVQMNTATAEECAAISEELKSMAVILAKIVSAFKIKTDADIANKPTAYNENKYLQDSYANVAVYKEQEENEAFIHNNIDLLPPF